MKGDFARQTFHAEKHYSGVLMQQGRVQLDADWNEQQSINRHRVESEAADLVGPAGVPRNAPGFEITPQGDDLLIGGGHLYLDGVLCENESDVLYSDQPDLRELDGPLLPAADGLYLAYLDAWERHITALEDASIRETALNGPDTATRAKTVWQVRLLPLANPGGAVDQDTSFPEWTELLRRNLIGIPDAGRLSARSQAEEPSPDPLCILPPTAGYRRLENQLYRVEVAKGGPRSEAAFKWSRDNGTVASAIEPDENDNVVNGSVIRVAEIGKDGMLTFASDPLPEWLELTDDRHELMNQRGVLARVQGVDPATRTITFAPGALPALDAARHPLVRRWDQRGADATSDGVAMTGDWQPLEDGVQVRFEEGVYREGDYWLIPARSAIGVETGSVEWPTAGPDPIPQPPHGARHHLTRLALVRRDAGAFATLPDGDCRRIFPPLTAITAADVGFSDATCHLGAATTVQEAIDILCHRGGSLCTLLLGPGDDLAAAIAQLAVGADALIGLRAGTYTLTQPLLIENRGHIRLIGAGPGTRIVAATSEAAVRFRSCSSVGVRQLYVETGAVGRGTPDLDDVNGSLTFLDCPSVAVEDVSVRCGGGALRAGACLTVRNSQPSGGSQALVRGCDLEVGHRQVGVLLVNVERTIVSDNALRAGPRPPDDVLLSDVDYRASLRPQLIAGIVPGGPSIPPLAGTNATVIFNNQTVQLLSDPGLLHGGRLNSEWQRAINALNPGGIVNARLLKHALLRAASNLLQRRGDGAGGSQVFRAVIAALIAQDTAAMGQGIVIAGLLARDVRISGNSVRGAIQGIHVGLGRGNAAAVAGVVRIEDNAIQVSLPTSANRQRHAIFVGHCDSLMIEGNFISLVRAARNSALRVEGMRLFGTMGRRVVVRQNHLGPQFAIGITFAPLNPVVPAAPLWIITENVMESASTKVDVPARLPGKPGVPNAVLVRQRIRGLNDNFA